MAADYSTAAAIMILTHYNKAPVMEQVDNYVLTARGKDAAGNANSHKYVNLSPDYTVAGAGATMELLECTDPVSMEKVNNIALVHS